MYISAWSKLTDPLLPLLLTAAFPLALPPALDFIPQSVRKVHLYYPAPRDFPLLVLSCVRQLPSPCPEVGHGEVGWRAGLLNTEAGCWRRRLRVPWTARRSHPSILKEISPEYSLEGLMLKLKLQYFGYLMQRANSLEKTLMLGRIEGRRRRGQQRTRRWGAITDSMDMSLSKL